MESIIDILSQGRDREGQASKVHGFVIGLVTNNNDPDKLGRVKVKFPWLSDDVESWWARVVQPMAGPSRGFWFIPEVDDEVLVGFEHGDVRFPYILGSLYNGKDAPPEPSEITSKFGGTGYDHGSYDPTDIQDGANDLRFIQSRSGHLVILDDKSGDEKITIADKTGKHRLEIFTKDKRIVITSEDGDIELIADKKILLRCEELITESRKNTEMNADGEFIAEAAKNMTLKTSKAFLAEAQNNVKIESKSGNLDAKASMNVTIDGTKVTAQASAMAKLKGGMAEVSASGVTVVKGSVVKIN